MDWDTENQPSHAQAFDKLTTRIHPGAIVLLHNTSQTNGEILDELLTKWENMGYTFRMSFLHHSLCQIGGSFQKMSYHEKSCRYIMLF